jgi:hypothetical protein
VYVYNIHTARESTMDTMEIVCGYKEGEGCDDKPGVLLKLSHVMVLIPQ